MKLTQFQVLDFRSINDSTPVDLVQRTVLVGRNESGKTSLLRVLFGLKPPGNTLPTFTLARDFPRDRPRRAFIEDMDVCRTSWTFDDNDREALEKVWPRAARTTGVEVSRSYKPVRSHSFEGLLPLDDAATPARHATAAVVGLVQASAAGELPLVDAVTSLSEVVRAPVADEAGSKWSTAVSEAAKKVRAALGPASAVAGQATGPLAEVEEAAAAIANDEECAKAARLLVVSRMPTFVYLDEWDEVPGHHDVPAYLDRKGRNALTDADRLFEKLLKVAELDAKELHQLLGQNHEERKLLTSRAGRVLTKTLRGLWKDRKVTVDFSLDEKHFDVLVSDADTEALVPLDERSRGFRWYFSFFITFAADTQGGDKEHAVLLLDEPGLFLHATAQKALLEFFETLPNQIIFTTHSPFMIDPTQIESVRTVNLVEGTGTAVSGVPTGDPNTLFPIQVALGYDLTQTLFVGTKTVLVEGVTDYWYLSTASEYLKEQGREGLAEGIVITPAGGAGKVPYMLALLTAQNLRVAVLFDSEPGAEATAKDVEKQKLIRPEGIVGVAAAFAAPPVGGADIEDVLGPDIFQTLVEESYAKKLDGQKLSWNAAIPRGAVRAADALKARGLEFHKTRPARLFLAVMGKDPARLITPAVQDRFERLFKELNAAVARLVSTGRAPFK